MSNKPLKKAVEIVQRLRHTDVARYPNSAAAEISDAVRPLRDAAREYLDYMSAEEPETYGPEEKKLDAALKEWEDIE